MKLDSTVNVGMKLAILESRYNIQPPAGLSFNPAAHIYIAHLVLSGDVGGYTIYDGSFTSTTRSAGKTCATASPKQVV